MSDVHHLDDRQQNALRSALRSLIALFTVTVQIIERIQTIDLKPNKTQADNDKRASDVKTIRDMFPRVDLVLGVLTAAKLTGHIQPWLEFKQTVGWNQLDRGQLFLLDLTALCESLLYKIEDGEMGTAFTWVKNLIELKRQLEIIETNTKTAYKTA